MTTAHRPTWKAAVGRAAEGGFGAPSSAQSILDVAAHTKLKVRKGHQLIHEKDSKGQGEGRRAQLLKVSLEKLKQAEAKLKLSKGSSLGASIEKREIIPAIEAEGELRLLKQTADVDEVKVKKKYQDQDEDQDVDDNNADGWSDLDSDGDNDDSDLDASDEDLDDSDDSDDDDEDDEAALQAELAKIRAERAAVKAKQEEEVAKEEEARLEEAALLGNPLLAATGGTSSGRLKRRWNDDVVFRNQAKDEPDRNKKRFINDTVRNDFHKRFLNKFIL